MPFDEEPGGFDLASLPPFPPMPPMPSAAPARAPVSISQPQKAAIIVRLLAVNGTKLKLERFSEDMQIELTRLMTTMRYISREALESVLNEFIEELEGIGLSFPGGLEGALSVLEGAISPSTAARLRKQAGFSMTGDPWERIGEMDPARLLPVLEEESIEICAVLLSKLKVSKAAQLLGMLKGERARRITYAVSLTGAVSPSVVQKIGLSISSQLDAQPAKAFVEAPVDRVGAILNSSPAATRDEVMEGLEVDDKEFADKVRKAIFTWANIATRIDPRDIPKITRGVDQAVLVKAMAASSGPNLPSVEFILSNMSQRMAGSLREEMEALGKVKEKEGEDAMGEVVGVIRELQQSGEIFFVTNDE